MIQKRNLLVIALFMGALALIGIILHVYPELEEMRPLKVLLGMIGLGYFIFYVHWLVTTKDEINSLGASIPSAWLMIIPLLNVYFLYKYSQAFSRYVKHGNGWTTFECFFFFVIFQPLAIIHVQSNLNKLADDEPTPIN